MTFSNSEAALIYLQSTGVTRDPQIQKGSRVRPVPSEWGKQSSYYKQTRLSWKKIQSGPLGPLSTSESQAKDSIQIRRAIIAYVRFLVRHSCECPTVADCLQQGSSPPIIDD
ncbi:hypothetical protein C0J52_09069 [Blattella germanica]|nr:hypothetical protein C0J52_09069 [Blattella germanica]